MAGPESNHREANDRLPHEAGRSHDAEAGSFQKLILRPQEIPLDDPQSKYSFQPSPAKPFVATPAALECFGREMIVACLQMLQRKAAEHNGIDYLQVFEEPTRGGRLWFMEDDEGGAITALLPSDY